MPASEEVFDVGSCSIQDAEAGDVDGAVLDHLAFPSVVHYLIIRKHRVGSVARNTRTSHAPVRSSDFEFVEIDHRVYRNEQACQKCNLSRPRLPDTSCRSEYRTVSLQIDQKWNRRNGERRYGHRLVK